MIKNKAYVNGKFVLGNEKLNIFSPETIEVIKIVPTLNKSQTQKAFGAAQESQRGWKLISHEKRIKIFEFGSCTGIKVPNALY